MLVFHEVVVGQQAVEAPKSPQHCRHPAGEDVNAARVGCRVETSEIFAGQSREILRVGQLAGEESTVTLDALDGVWTEAPLLRLVEARDLGADRLPAFRFEAPTLVGRFIPLGSIAAAMGDDLVSGTVIKR